MMNFGTEVIGCAIFIFTVDFTGNKEIDISGVGNVAWTCQQLNFQSEIQKFIFYLFMGDYLC